MCPSILAGHIQSSDILKKPVNTYVSSAYIALPALAHPAGHSHLERGKYLSSGKPIPDSFAETAFIMTGGPHMMA